MGIVYYPDLQKHSPCRQPDWRWRRAQWLVANRRHLSHRHDDEKTRRVVAYLRYLRQSHVGQELARRRDPDLACAHSIHSTGGTTRTLIEAHVLARQGSAEISTVMDLRIGVIDAYVFAFFDCRRSLDAADWILTHAIDVAPFALRNAPEAGRVLKLFAYHGGPAVLSAVMPYLVGGRDLFSSAPDLSTAEGRLEQRIRIAIASTMLPRNPVIARKQHRIMLLLQEAQQSQPLWRVPALLFADTDQRPADDFGDAQDYERKLKSHLDVAAAAEHLARQCA